MFSLRNHIFKVQTDVRLNTTHFFIIKIPNKREIAINDSSNIGFKDFMKIYKIAKEYSFLVNYTTLPSENLLRFRKNR